MNQDTIAVILAGGFGTRVKHLLPNIPKPMASVAGKPFVEWIIKYLFAQGLTDIILSTGYLAEVIQSYFETNPIEGINLESYQETKPLGTGGGFVNIVKQSGKKPKAWLITNGDSLIFTDLSPLWTYLADDSVSGVILGLSVTDTSRYGSLVYDQDGNLVNFAEKQPGKGVINAGVYLLRHNLVTKFPSINPLSFEQDIFPFLLQQGIKIKVQIVTAPFLDIGTPATLSQAEQFIQQNWH
jgi:D-glycero-alpha-D-manno-heptose 1-phosphate guanylyltransferase